MRYKLLGDLLTIKSALLYKRGYVDTSKNRNPICQMNSIRTKDSNYTSFMEYNFKFKIDKGFYSSSNPYEDFSSSFMNELNSEDLIGYLPLDNLMYQSSSDSSNKRYSLFEVYNSGSYSNIIVEVPYDIQKIEFYNSFMDNEINDGYITDIEEYIEGDQNHFPGVPILIIEFGPEESYEDEDYYNKEDMPVKPEWGNDEEIEYQKLVDEYNNNKFLIVSTTSSDSNSLNLSLLCHESQKCPHRNQDKNVLSNKDLKATFNEREKTTCRNGKFILDERSSSLLSTKSMDKSNMIIFNDLINLSSDKIKVEINDDSGEVTEIKEYNKYRDFIVYNKGDEVYYEGEVYKSLINGNLYENPSISPMWEIVEDLSDPQEPETPIFVINVRVNDPSLGTADPLGPTNIEYGYELTINIIHEISSIKSVLLDGSPIEVKSDKIVLTEVTSDHDVFIEFDPIYKNVTIKSNPEDGGITEGSGSYLMMSDVTVSSTPNEGFEFVNWTDESGNEISTSNEYIIKKLSEDITLISNFRKITYHIAIDSSDGGTYTPKTGNPSVINVSHGDDLEINILPKSGYEVEYVTFDSEVAYKNEDIRSYTINNITSDHSVFISFSRPTYHVTDPIIGRINYSIVGDQIWSINDLSYVDDSIGSVNGGNTYYSASDISSIDSILKNGGTKFRVPSKSDIEVLFSYLDPKEVGMKVKSPNITRFNSNGWIDSIYRGIGKFRLDFNPIGLLSNDSPMYLGYRSSHWTSTNDGDLGVSFQFFSDSPSGFIVNSTPIKDKLGIRLVSDIPSVTILGDKYRYITISLNVDVKNSDTSEVEKYNVTQSWTLDNLRYSDIGVTYEDSECKKFGGLYDIDNVSEITRLVNSESHNFRVPSNIDYILLEKFLGYSKDSLIISNGEMSVDQDSYYTGYIGTTEGKRLKAGDFIYSGINWNGYSTRDPENSQLNVVPSGYGVKYDNVIDFLGMGTESKFWTSTIVNEDSKTAYSRSLSFSDDRIFRGVDSGSRNLMSIRMVDTTYKKVGE